MSQNVLRVVLLLLMENFPTSRQFKLIVDIFVPDLFTATNGS